MPYFDLLTWRECVVGMKPAESVQMEIRRTWDVRSKNLSGASGNQIERTPGGVNSENLGLVRWRIRDEELFHQPCRLIRSEGYDVKAHLLVREEIWTNLQGDLVRQREERTGEEGKEVAEAVFWPDRIELSQIGRDGKSRFAQLHPAGGMAEIQRRFKPMEGTSKEFLRLDALAGSFRKVKIERTGRFRGQWGEAKYEGTSYRFTVEGKTTILMLTPEEEIVQVAFNEETALVLNSPTRSRRKG